MKRVHVSIMLPEELLEEVDRARGIFPRSRFIEQLIRLGLEEWSSRAPKPRRVEARGAAPAY